LPPFLLFSLAPVNPHTHIRMSAIKKTGAGKPAAHDHPSYKDMVAVAVTNLKERSGSSRQAIKKYIHANFSHLTKGADSLINTAIKRGVAAGEFTQPKGASGPVKLGKQEGKEAKKTVKRKETEKKERKPAGMEKKEKKPTAAKKTARALAVKKMVKGPAAKKAKEPTEKKATAKKAASKTAVAKAAPKKTLAKKVLAKKPATATKASASRKSKA